MDPVSTDVSAAEWDALADRVGAPPFLRPGWIDAWHRAFGGPPLQIVAVRRAGELVAVAPLQRRGPVLRGAANDHTPMFGVLALDEEARAAAVAASLERAPQVVTLEALAAEEAQRWAEFVREQGLRVELRPQARQPYIAIDGDWERYRRTVRRPPAKLRRNLRRLGEQGEVSFDVHDGRDDLDELLREGFELEASGWKASEGTAIASDPAVEGFYRDVASWAAERGWLRLCFLRVASQGAAFIFGLQASGAFYHLKGGYQPGLRMFAPGLLLLEATLQRAFSERLQRFELLGDAEPWKLEWTEDCHERVLLSAYGNRPVGRAAWLADSVGRPLARRLGVRRLVRRLRT